ncbi:MAG: TonB-dependent receptor [Cyclobacteriaceae bacterium]
MKVLFLFLLSVISLQSIGQVKIGGFIKEKSGEPLLGVNVFVDGTYDGATTDIDGKFSITTDEADTIVLVAKFIGFHDHKVQLDNNVSNISLEIFLNEKINKLNAVVITAGSFNASEERKQVVLNSLDIVTTAGSSADVPGALNTLPGTQTVGETGRLFVRGGEGRETKTFIDGMIVHNEYSPSAPNTPGRSRFSPFMFKGMSFSTGGYSAEYGQALSSALILQSKDIAAITRTDLSLMTVGADVAHSQVWKNSSFSGKVQYTNLTPYFALVGQNIKWDKAPTDYNGNFAYRLKTSKTGMLKFYSNMSTSDMDLYERDIANPEILLPTSVGSDYFYFNTSYKEILTKKWGATVGASMTESNDFAAQAGQSRGEDISGRHGKLVLDFTQSDKLAFKFGGEVLLRKGEENLTNTNGQILSSKFDETISSGFVEAESYLSSSLAFKVGARVENNSLVDKATVNPRVSAAYKLAERSQVSLAYGTFRQAPSNAIIYRQNDAGQELAEHFIVNYQWIGERRSFRIEGYRKNYSELTRFQNEFDPTTFSFDGDGFAEGLDLFWRDTKTFKNTDYWVSYSYLNSERNYRNYPDSFRPPFVSTHNFSVVGKRFIQSIRSQLGLTYAFASRRRYNDLNTENFLGGKTPSYHNLSFNISYLYSNQIIFHAMVNNVFGINNIFGYEYANQPDANGIYARRAIEPPAKRFLFLGVFITLAKNKSISQLPNL